MSELENALLRIHIAEVNPSSTNVVKSLDGIPFRLEQPVSSTTYGEIFVMPLSLEEDGIINGMHVYPFDHLDELSNLVSRYENDYLAFLENLPSKETPIREITEIKARLDNINFFLDRYQACPTLLGKRTEDKLGLVARKHKSLYSRVNDMLFSIGEVQKQIGGSDRNIFNIDLSAVVYWEGEVAEEREIMVQIGEFLAILSPTGPQGKYLKKDFIHYLTGGVTVRLTHVDKENELFYSKVLNPSSKALQEYCNYLKSNAEKTNNLEHIKELFAKANNFEKYLANSTIEGKALEKFRDVYDYIEGKYIISIAEKSSEIKRLTSSDIDEINEPDDVKIEMKVKNLDAWGLCCNFLSRERIIATFSVFFGEDITRIVSFSELNTNQNMVHFLLAKKLLENEFYIHPIGYLFPGDGSNIYFAAPTKLKRVPALIYKKRDPQHPEFYLYQIKSQ